MAETKTIIFFLVSSLLFPSYAISHHKRFTLNHHVAPVASALLASLALTTPLPYSDPPSAANQSANNQDFTNQFCSFHI